MLLLNKTLFIAIIIVIALIFAISLSVLIAQNRVSSNSMIQAEQGQVVVLSSDTTVSGSLAGVPCGALRLPCTSSVNQNYTVELVSYQGNEYYLAHFSLTSNGVYTNYTIWFNNSTAYCVSPKVQWYNSCPTS